MFKKTLITLLILLVIACQQPANNAPASSEITQVAFSQAIEKYLGTEGGQEKVANAVQDFFKKQQMKVAKQKEADAGKELEEQFNNPLKVDVSGSPVKGPENAKITIVEFSDFECPFCKRGANTIDQVMKAYPNDVKLVFKNLPLPFHKEAKPAAKAALAAGKQGKFYEFHDELFANQSSLGEKLYMDTAKKLGLNIDKFKADMASKEIEDQIEKDSKQADEVGISGTPGFIVGGVAVRGAYPVDHFKKIIDRLLSGTPAAPAA